MTELGIEAQPLDTVSELELGAGDYSLPKCPLERNDAGLKHIRQSSPPEFGQYEIETVGTGPGIQSQDFQGSA